MKKIIYYLIPFIFMPISIYAQFTCANDDIAPPSVNSIGATCAFSPYYTPDDLTQTKNVRITLHVVQDDDGLNNFQDTPTERDWLINTMVANMNWVMRTLQPMNLPTTSVHIQDSKVQYEVDDILFHQNTYLYDFPAQGNIGGSNAHNMGNQLYNLYVTNNSAIINKTNSIHIFFVSGSGGRACGIPCNNWTLVGNAYQNYLNGGDFWNPAGLLRHELGHNLGLYHTWYGDNCNDTPNNPNCWNYNEPPSNPNCSIPSNNMMDYNSGKNALTECQLANMHHYLTKGNGQNVVINHCETSNNLIIDNNSINTWYNTRYIQGDLIIKNNSTLVVTCEVYMPDNSRIIIEKGGKLIVDGGIITNKCDGMWKGIEVHGNSNASQLTAGTQGKLEIKNGALIENCHSIHASEHDATGQYVWGTFGGIIQINNSIIKNVKSGVEFGPYQNFNPNNSAVLLSDLSFIKDNQFIWDNTGNMAVLGIQPYSFIGLWETHGIGIEGNSFKNDFIPSSPFYQKGVGIITYDADFTVKPSCSSNTFPCPASSNVPNIFESLNYGIKAHGISNVARVIVDGNVFTNNRFGVGLLATKYTSVIKNSFNIPISSIPIESGGDAIGIYSTGSYGYNFEENQFSTWGIGPSSGSNYGIVSDNSSLNGGLAYKNVFNNLIVASLNSQDNTSLKIDCNNFNTGTLSRYDMAITSGDLANQGACAIPSIKPSKNSFNAGCSTSDKNIFHYTNTPASLIYSALPADLPNCVTTPEVFNASCVASTPNQCPSNISNPVAPSELVANINTNKTAITNLKEQFDGGNQSGLLSVISSMPNGQVKNELMVVSPYLSDKVLVSFLQKPNPLPAGHVKQIIVANSPVTEKVKQILDAVALPNGIRSQIEVAQTGISSRQVLENEIAQLELENQLMKNEYIRQCLDQKLLNNAKDLLDNGNLCSDKASLLPIIVKEDLSRTDQLISEIRDEVVIIRDEIPNCPKAATLEKICDFYDEVKTKIAATGSFKITSATDEQNIRLMAAKTGATAINAQNALSLFKGENIERFAEPIILTPSNARLLRPQPSNTQFQSGVDYKLNNYPNPFNESTVLEATIPINTSGEIVITDVTGKQIQRVVLNNTENKVELRGNELGYGIFFYSLYINGEYIQTKKLTRIQ